MALIKCPECGKEISDRATSCPNCGYPISQDSKSATENFTSSESVMSQSEPAQKSVSELAQKENFFGKNSYDQPTPPKKRKKLKRWQKVLIGVISLILVLAILFVIFIVIPAIKCVNAYNAISPYLDYVGKAHPDEDEAITLTQEEYDNIDNVEFMGMRGEMSFKLKDGYISSCTWTSFDFYSEEEYREIAEDLYIYFDTNPDVEAESYGNGNTYHYSWIDPYYGFSVTMAHGFFAYDPDGKIEIRWETSEEACDIVGHAWVDATCADPKTCNVCGVTEGSALEHTKGEWVLTEDATLTDVGVEEILCTVCGESLDSRGTERKTPKIIGNTFNFTDEELIDWANSWLNGTYEIEDYGHFDLGSDILGYRVETDDGEDGMLLLKHDGGDEVSAIMVYFDNFVDRSALALFFGTKINTAFVYDDAALILANNSTYFAADMIATNLTIDDGLEVALLTPESYMYKIISGTTLSPSDCYISIEHNEALYEKYNNNMWDLICSEYGENRCYWFWVENFDDDLHSGLGEITTYRGITLGVSTEKEIIDAYGKDMEYSFNKNTDDLYRSIRAGGYSDYLFLENTRKVLVYDYKGQFQIAFYIDSTGIVDCIAYFDGEWYGD